MSEEKRSGGELEDEPSPMYSGGFGSMPEATPFDKATDLLAETKGETLELMCRTTNEVAEATAIAYAMIYRFHSSYINGRIEQIQRLTVSNGGKGRAEVVQSLQAGSGVSDGFYEAQSGGNQTFTPEEG